MTSLITLANDGGVADVTAVKFNLFDLLTINGTNKGYSASKTFDPLDLPANVSVMIMTCEVGDLYLADDKGVSSTHYFKKLQAGDVFTDYAHTANIVSLKTLFINPSATGAKLAIYLRSY